VTLEIRPHLGQLSGVVEDRLKILVVEDDRVYSEFIAETLREAGHEITLAGDGASAREQARATNPDAVILDLGLPDESGFQTARALRAGILGTASIIVLLTANMFPDRDTAEALGIDIVLSKPVQPSVVVGIVDLVHARRAARRR
jgi:DNA-binding response OmpR family regulator